MERILPDLSRATQTDGQQENNKQELEKKSDVTIFVTNIYRRPSDIGSQSLLIVYVVLK